MYMYMQEGLRMIVLVCLIVMLRIAKLLFYTHMCIQCGGALYTPLCMMYMYM